MSSKHGTKVECGRLVAAAADTSKGRKDSRKASAAIRENRLAQIASREDSEREGKCMRG